MKYMRSVCICNTFETIHDNGRHCGVAFDGIYLQWWFYYDIHRVRSSMFWILNTEFISITIQTKMILFFFFLCVQQIFAALAVSIGPLAAGLGKGYSSPAIASLQEMRISTHGNYTSFTISDQEASWVASLSLLGEFNTKVVQFQLLRKTANN